jgi:hypothetical protein
MPRQNRLTGRMMMRGLRVRIHFPPAASLRILGPSAADAGSSRPQIGAGPGCSPGPTAVFDHNVRNATREGLAVPSRQVHNDHTVNSAPRRVRDHLGADAEELLKHRFGIVSVRRPIRGPVQDSPLALCASAYSQPRSPAIWLS